MTQEQKARAYDEALERAREIMNNTCSSETTKITCQEIFPDIMESEDEKIRKFLIDILSSGVWRTEWPFSPVDCVAYLEKQKEQKRWSEEDENMLNSCISSIEEAKENRYYYRETDGDTSYDHEISWLKSLRPRPHWTPSEEHLSALLAIINDPNNIWSQTCQLALSDLHEQLKWLKKIEDNANKDNT